MDLNLDKIYKMVTVSSIKEGDLLKEIALFDDVFNNEDVLPFDRPSTLIDDENKNEQLIPENVKINKIEIFFLKILISNLLKYLAT